MGEFGLISPEKVRLNLNLAGIGSRFAAAFIDQIFIMIVIAFFLLASLLLWGVGVGIFQDAEWLFNEATASTYAFVWLALLLLLIFCIFYGYNIVFETIWNGQTPGKRFLKIRVAQKDGSSVTFAQVLVRNMLRIIDSLPLLYAIGIISVLMTKKNQRLGDLVAGTIVLREKTGSAPAALYYDVPAAAWASTARLHVHEITEADFTALKDYLIRKDTLIVKEAAVLEQRLVAHFSKKLRVNSEEIQDLDTFLKQVAQLYQTNG